MKPVEIEVPPRQSDTDYKRPKMSSQRFVPEVYRAISSICGAIA